MARRESLLMFFGALKTKNYHKELQKGPMWRTKKTKKRRKGESSDQTVRLQIKIQQR